MDHWNIQNHNLITSMEVWHYKQTPFLILQKKTKKKRKKKLQNRALAKRKPQKNLVPTTSQEHYSPLNLARIRETQLQSPNMRELTNQSTHTSKKTEKNNAWKKSMIHLKEKEEKENNSMHGWHETPSYDGIGEGKEWRKGLLEHSDNTPTKP